ncbi:Ldh family oxidoreductase [Leucobacter sp. HY1910]
MHVSVEEARVVAASALASAGVQQPNRDVIVDALIEAELRGLHSHGLLRLPRMVERIHNGVADANSSGAHTWTAQAHLSVDGQRGIGQVVAHRALEEISERARTTGVAIATISNSNHIGMLALYAEQIARRGQVLIGLTTSEALVHPWGGRTAMVGTNPITIGVPAEPYPFVLDMATGLVSMGKVHDYAHRGESLPIGWALDAEGEPTTNAAAAKDGAIAPFGGPKGYALGLAFEVLVASLTASATGRDVAGTLDSTQVCNKGDVFIVAEPAGTLGLVTKYLAGVRATAPADPDYPVLVPGDRARVTREKNLTAGIDVADAVWQRLRELASAARAE